MNSLINLTGGDPNTTRASWGSAVIEGHQHYDQGRLMLSFEKPVGLPMRTTWPKLGSHIWRRKCFSYFFLSHGLFISIRARSQCTCELRSCVGPQQLSEPAGSWAQAGKHRAKRFALVVPARQRHGAVMGGDPSKVAPSVFRTAAVSRPHHRLHQPWVAAPRSGAVTRRARRRTSWRRVGATRPAAAVFAGGARGGVADARTAQSLAAAGVRASHCCGTTWPTGPTALRTTLIHACSSGLARRESRPVRGQAI